MENERIIYHNDEIELINKDSSKWEELLLKAAKDRIKSITKEDLIPSHDNIKYKEFVVNCQLTYCILRYNYEEKMFDEIDGLKLKL